MRNYPNLRVQRFQKTGHGGIAGTYIVSCLGVPLTVIVTSDRGWEHVSVSMKNRCPTWEEMDYVRELFFRDDETAMQLHVPKSDHVNLHRFCLHLWRPIDVEIPRPPALLVV